MTQCQQFSYYARLFICLILFCSVFCCTGSASAPSIAGMMEIPESASAGDAIVIIDYISNYGSSAYGPFVLEYYLSKEALLTSNAIYLGDRRFPQISPRSEQRTAVPLTIPSSIAEGSYYIIRAEDGVQNGASDTTIFVSGSTSLPMHPVPDTPITPPSPVIPSTAGVYFSPLQGPMELYIDESFQIFDEIHNSDSQTARLVEVTYSLIRDPATAKGRQIGSWKVLNLKPGDTQSNDRKVSGAGLIPGHYYLMREAKMVGSSGVKLLEPRIISPTPIMARYNPRGAYPDLTQVRTEFPRRPNPGDIVEITDIITNIGNACARDVVVAYYASPSPTFDPAGALLLGHTRIGQICPGEQIMIVTPVTIPHITSSGSYYLYSVIDPCAFIVESCTEILPEFRKDNNINGGTIKARGHCFTGLCVF